MHSAAYLLSEGGDEMERCLRRSLSALFVINDSILAFETAEFMSWK